MYSEKIMEEFYNPKNFGVIKGASGVGKVTSDIGSEIIKIFISVEDNKIKDAEFQTFGGVVAIAIALGVLFGAYPDLLLPIYNVLISIGAGIVIFMMLYCILDGSYIGEVFSTVASWTVRWPGLIFSWSIDGFIWAISMKILFAILSVLLAITMLVLAIGLSSALSIVSFPFLLAHDIRHGYDDCLF